jgi:hypothetical protein
MDRRGFVQALAVGTAGVATGRGTAAEVGASPSGPNAADGTGALVTTPLVLQAPRADGVEALWGIRERCLGRIEWRSVDGASGVVRSDAFGFNPQATRFLRIRLSGFKPGRDYELRSVTTAAEGATREEFSGWKHFRTLDPAARESHFTVWNDTHVNNETLQRLDEVTPASDFHIWNGDTCNDWHREEDLIPTLLHPGGRDITRGRPMHLIWGNHDVRGAWAFRMPDLVATPTGRPFHAFRSGPVGVICLHTGEDKPDDHPSFRGRVAFDALRREQAAWLEEAIRRPELRHAPYRVVFCHIPLRWTDESVQDYAKGGFDRHSGRSRAAWHASLARWKAQVIVSGHTHHTAWIPADRSFPYGQLVGGGPQPASATWLEGQADRQALNLTLRKLDGSVVHAVRLRPVG